MAEKISTLILKVDLECHRCYKKIKKTLCKLQDRENIKAIAYDEKNNTVTISGPFDPHRLSKKLYCKACNVIKDIQIKENVPKEKPKDDKPKEKEKEKEKDKPKTTPPQPKQVEPAPLQPEPKPPKPKEEPPKPVPVVQGPVIVYTPPPPAWPAGPVCGCRPYCEGNYWGYCNCERPYHWGPSGPPTYHFFCEEDRSCRIM